MKDASTREDIPLDVCAAAFEPDSDAEPDAGEPVLTVVEAGRTTGAVSCPRCGYDQRGVVSQWRASCPLTGRCTECGLAFDWIEVFTEREAPAWCIESPYRAGAIDAVIGWFGTVVRAVWPWGFWGRLRLSHEVAGGRLALFVLLCAACLWLTFALQAAALAMVDGFSPSQGLFVALVPLSTQPIDVGDPWSAAAGAWRLSTPLDFSIEVLQRGGVLTLGAMIFFACGTLVFLLLPASRRRAKVRWAHIGRIVAYGAVLPVAMLTVGWIGVFSPGQLFSFLGMAVAMITAVVFCFVFWMAAIHRYLRIPNAWAVALSMVFFGVLIPPVVIVILVTFVE